MLNISLQELIENYKKKPDQEALEQLYLYFKPYILQWARAYIQDASLCEDILQEVAIKLFKQANHINELETLPYWVKKVTRNTCIDYLRKRDNQNRILSPDYFKQFPDLTFQREILSGTEDLTLQLIQKLSGKAKHIFIEHYLLEKDIHTIAHTTGEKTSNIYNILSRARKSLSTARLEQGFEEMRHYSRQQGLPCAHTLDQPKSESPYTTFVHTFSTLLQYTPQNIYTISDIAGYTGQAFRIHFSIHGQHEMSPYIFHWSRVARKSFAMLGYASLCFGYPRYPEVKLERTIEAIKQITHSIYSGYPVIVWNLSPNEFSLIYGYNHEDQYFIYADVSNKTKLISFHELHELTTKQELFFAILKGKLQHFQSSPQLKLSFQQIIAHFTGEEPEIEGTVQGLSAYLQWMSAIQKNSLEPLAHAYSVANYHEWRGLALTWLASLLDRSDIPTVMKQCLKDLVNLYTEICQLFASIYPRFPASRHLYDAEERNKTLTALARIYELESAAVMLFKKF